MARSLADIMRLVENMLARAEGLDESSPEEAKLMRAKAEHWMAQYRIAEEDLIAAEPGSIEPVEQEMDVVATGNPFFNEHFWMLGDIAKHTGVLWEYHWSAASSGRKHGGYYVTLVGYDGDVRYAAQLFQSARLVFGARLTPGVNSNLSEEENIYRLRASGMTRPRISELLWGAETPARNARVQKVYEAECAKRGERATVAGRGIDVKTYREVYAREFVARLAQRLREARDSAGELGGLPELHGRKERVQEYFWKRFPHRRPKPETDEPMGEAQPCEKCQRTKHASGKCKDHRYEITKAQQARIERMYYSPTARRATQAGREAAEGVVLQRGHHQEKMESGEGVQAIEG
jgi:hypothetical protein